MPRGDHRLGPAGQLAVVEAAEQDGHEQRGRPARRRPPRACRRRGTSRSASSVSRPPSRFGDDQVDGVHALSEVARGRTGRGAARPSGRPLHEQLGPAVLVEELPAAPAGHERLAVAVHAGDGHEPAAARGVEGRHDPALGAQASGRRTRSPRSRPRASARRRPARRRRRGSRSTARRPGSRRRRRPPAARPSRPLPRSRGRTIPGSVRRPAGQGDGGHEGGSHAAPPLAPAPRRAPRALAPRCRLRR